MPGTLVLLRHGQSTWNLENLFTGWHDVPLTPQARRRRSAAGGRWPRPACASTSPTPRCSTAPSMTNHLALAEMGQVWLPVQRHWRLNERHYGALQGLNKRQTAERHGAEQTKLWRRSYDVPPPPVDRASPEHPVNDPRYRLLAPEVLPAAECLADVVPRVLPYWHDVDRAPIARRDRRAGHRPRQLTARVADAPRRCVTPARSPRSTSRPASPAATSSTTPSAWCGGVHGRSRRRSPPRPQPWRGAGQPRVTHRRSLRPHPAPSTVRAMASNKAFLETPAA